MKFPSLASLSRNAVAVFKRFPTLFIVVASATVLACFLMGEPPIGAGLEHKLWRLLATCDLLLTLGLAADLFAESRTYTGLRKWGLRVAVFILCGLLYAVLNPVLYQTDVVRLGLFIFAFHHLVAFAPFIKRGSNSDFWHFNKVLFLRFLTAVLYSVSLYAGLAVAIFGIEELFNLDLPSEIYGQLFVLVAVGFNTLFFLAGIPTVFETTPTAEPYPKGLKIFTQYVLIPLMTIYLAILLVYEIKILVEWEMPKGIVATLILGYAVFGMLSLLLVWPIRNDEGSRWVRLFSKSFYLTMLPLIVLLALAVYQRVSHYGFTEERHILMALTIWLTAITAYFLSSRKDDIRLIPVSLAALALLSTFGPQSATNISLHSQQRRLAQLLNAPVEGTDERQSVVTYLLEAHGLQSMQAFTETDLDSLGREITATNAELPPYRITWLKRDTIFALLGVPPSAMADGRYLTIHRAGERIIPVQGYDYVYRVDSYGSDSTMVAIGKNNVRISVKRDSTFAVKVEMENDTAIVFDLVPLVDEIYQAHKGGNLTPHENDGTGFLYPAEKMEIQRENTHFVITLLLDQVNGDFLAPHEESSRGIYFTGYVLFGEK
ncbi:DUF4153 domain-containing protein [Parapedobacter sp. 10938]|uniref:DUF4153 domain-containing protein n=1 Tax=Parapedobacter flavus TaxID=3110225 RepID=UPI002DBB05E6|nr:DUF4153 domain-containing protein [Parapedobacter sp. 10938]MEC3879977.1 DUF4153 domain-containing protein [Parapedobacter sp. 10938]